MGQGGESQAESQSSEPDDRQLSGEICHTPGTRSCSLSSGVKGEQSPHQEVSRVQHEEFAKRTAERLEAVAKAIEDEERRIGRGEVSARANEMRVAARVVRDASETVTRRENRQYSAERSPLEVPS